MLNTKSQIISNIMASLSITSLLANVDIILTTLILITTLIINAKILYDKFFKKVDNE